MGCRAGATALSPSVPSGLFPPLYTPPVTPPPLPARVRVTRPPLPLAPALKAAAARLYPQAPTEALSAAVLAIAGGAVIGAALRWEGGKALGLDVGWRGRGLEEALESAVGENTTPG